MSILIETVKNSLPEPLARQLKVIKRRFGDGIWWTPTVDLCKTFNVVSPIVIIDRDTPPSWLKGLQEKILFERLDLGTFDLTFEGHTFGGMSVHLCSDYLLAQADAIIVLATTPEEFLSSLRLCHRTNSKIPVIPCTPIIPQRDSRCEFFAGRLETRIHIYNYFEAYNLIKEPIQVLYEILDEEKSIHKGSLMLGPNEHTTLSSRDLALGDFQRGLLTYQAFHPSFARASNRFRLMSDVYSKTSVDSVHGIEWKRKSDATQVLAQVGMKSDATFVIEPLETSRKRFNLEITLESASTDDSEHEVLTKTIVCDSSHPIEFHSVKEIFPQLEQAKDRWYYITVGSSPIVLSNWYLQKDVEKGDSLAANHGLPKGQHGNPRRTSPPDLAAVEKKRDLALMQFPVPIFPPSLDLREMVFFNRYRREDVPIELIAYDMMGGEVERKFGNYSFQTQDYIDLKKEVDCPALFESGGLIIIRDVGHQEALPPSPYEIPSTFFCIEREGTEDLTFTELQGARVSNLPGYIPSRPGRYLPNRSTKTTTHAMTRVVVDTNHDTLLTMINVSTGSNYETRANVDLVLTNAQGETRVARVSILPMTHWSGWISQLFPNIQHFCINGVGWIRVICRDANLFGYTLLTRHDTKAISVQHYWGA